MAAGSGTPHRKSGRAKAHLKVHGSREMGALNLRFKAKGLGLKVYGI